MAGSSSSLSNGGQDCCDISGLARRWDRIPEIRERLHEGHPLFGDVSERLMDIKTPSKLHFVMEPLLVAMSEHGKKLPSIDALRGEIRKIYKLSYVEMNEAYIEGSAWSLRKHCGFIKMKCRKSQPSMAS